MIDWAVFDKALFRCLAEIQLVVAQHWARYRLENLLPEAKDPRIGFYGIASTAFASSSEIGLARVLEKTKDQRVLGFWWLHDFAKEEIPLYDPSDSQIAFLIQFSKRLRRLRIATLAHIGIEVISNPRKLKRVVRITDHEFNRAATLTRDFLWDIYDFRHSNPTWTMDNREMVRLDYDGSDIASILGSSIKETETSLRF